MIPFVKCHVSPIMLQVGTPLISNPNESHDGKVIAETRYDQMYNRLEIASTYFLFDPFDTFQTMILTYFAIVLMTKRWSCVISVTLHSNQILDWIRTFICFKSVVIQILCWFELSMEMLFSLAGGFIGDWISDKSFHCLKKNSQ